MDAVVKNCAVDDCGLCYSLGGMDALVCYAVVESCGVDGCGCHSEASMDAVSAVVVLECIDGVLFCAVVSGMSARLWMLWVVCCGFCGIAGRCAVVYINSVATGVSALGGGVILKATLGKCVSGVWLLHTHGRERRRGEESKRARREGRKEGPGGHSGEWVSVYSVSCVAARSCFSLQQAGGAWRSGG